MTPDASETATSRFENRLTEDVASLGLDIVALRVEIAAMYRSLIRWMFVFWLLQVSVNVSVVVIVLRATKLH